MILSPGEVHPGLLQAVLEHPQDMDLRCVLADAMEESGNTSCRPAMLRGQFDQTSPCNWWAAVPELMWVWEKLDLEVWFDGVMRRPGPPGLFQRNPCLDIRRGFAERIVCNCNQWRRFGHAIVSNQPLVRVDILDRQPLEYTWPEEVNPNVPGADVLTWWLWYSQIPNRRVVEFTEKNTLPRDLYSALSFVRPESHRYPFRHFASRIDAETVLSEAALYIAKAQALRRARQKDSQKV